MCTLFLDSGEFCEPCAAALESESFVDRQSAQLNSPTSKDLGEDKKTEAEFIPPTRHRDQDKLYIWLGVGTSFSMIFFGLLVYAYPSLFLDSATLAAMQEEQRLEDCRLVFEEITYLLRAGDLPDESMSCEGTNIPNPVRRVGSTVRVDHPNPGQFGLTEFYVTNESHQVHLVGGGAS